MCVLQSVCSESASFDLTAPFLGGCIQEANEAYVVAVKRQESNAHGGQVPHHSLCNAKEPLRQPAACLYIHMDSSSSLTPDYDCRATARASPTTLSWGRS